MNRLRRLWHAELDDDFDRALVTAAAILFGAVAGLTAAVVLLYLILRGG